VSIGGDDDDWGDDLPSKAPLQLPGAVVGSSSAAASNAPDDDWDAAFDAVPVPQDAPTLVVSWLGNAHLIHSAHHTCTVVWWPSVTIS
jgi:hypothetical protein